MTIEFLEIKIITTKNPKDRLNSTQGTTRERNNELKDESKQIIQNMA